MKGKDMFNPNCAVDRVKNHLAYKLIKLVHVF